MSTTIGRDHVVNLVTGNPHPFAVHFDLVVVAHHAALGRATIHQVCSTSLGRHFLRDLPDARNARQTITTSNGGRERLAHRLDLLWAKGRLPSIAAILAESSSLSMVISPTLDFSRAISSSRSSRSRSFKAVAAPASARSRHSVSLAMETFVCRATRSSGSPRNSRATITILR